MSIWTHVASIIRIDSFRLLDDSLSKSTKELFLDIFGKECHWESPEEIWIDAENHPENYLPMGSEGSLKMSIWKNPSRSSMAAYTVSIFGDLRDYDDLNAIKTWFKTACDKVLVRQAVITATNEYDDYLIYDYILDTREKFKIDISEVK